MGRSAAWREIYLTREFPENGSSSRSRQSRRARKISRTSNPGDRSEKAGGGATGARQQRPVLDPHRRATPREDAEPRRIGGEDSRAGPASGEGILPIQVGPPEDHHGNLH